MARKGRVAGPQDMAVRRRGRGSGGYRVSCTRARSQTRLPNRLTRGACRGPRNTGLRPRAKFGAHKGGDVEIELYAVIDREKER
jgi:hypothetical protein